MNINLKSFIIISTACMVFSCKHRQTKTEPKPVADSSKKINIPVNDTILLTLTKQVLTSIKKKDYKTFAEFIHPDLGVRFSPYAYVDTTSDMKFSSDGFLNAVRTKKKFNWGSSDGSGETILLTVENYFSKFVYNADFLNAEKMALNKMIGGGNSLNNLKEVYAGCDFTESYFSGFDKKLDGMDWCCLRLVFKKHFEKFYLVGIVHDQWTI